MTPSELAARAIATRLSANGFTAYLAGGCVRDRLLGRDPKDFDVATDAPATTVQQIFSKTIPVGVQFGVVLVIHDEHAVEVATFRSDAAYLDGRHPVSVRFSTPEEDAQRRDFTINGMFLDPATDTLIDYVGGQADLKAGVIRAIGDPQARIREDRLRMLRAVRFAARLGFRLDPATRAAIQTAASGITDMAWERIGDEIVRMLCDSSQGSARVAFELLDETGLLARVLPEIDAMHAVEQSPDYHPEGDVFVHTMHLLEQLDGPSESLALGALLHDVAKPQCFQRRPQRITFYGHSEIGAEMAVTICQRLRRSRETSERVAYLVKNHLKPTNAKEMRLSTLKRFLAHEAIDELLALARFDAMASNKDLTHVEYCRAKLAALGSEAIKPPPLLRGDDLIALGFNPGPLFGKILSDALDAQLEGDVRTHEEAIAWVRRQYL